MFPFRKLIPPQKRVVGIAAYTNCIIVKQLNAKNHPIYRFPSMSRFHFKNLQKYRMLYLLDNGTSQKSDGMESVPFQRNSDTKEGSFPDFEGAHSWNIFQGSRFPTKSPPFQIFPRNYSKPSCTSDLILKSQSWKSTASANIRKHVFVVAFLIILVP